MARSKKTPRIGEIQYERLFDWSGGMNNAVNPVLLKDNESPLLENASLDEKGTLFPRMGSRDRYSEQIGNEPVTGIGTYYKSDGTSRLLISAGTKLYEDNPHIMDIFENQDEFEQGTIAGSASITKKPNSVVNEEDPEDVELKIDTEEEWDTGEKDNIVVNPDGTISLAKAGEDIEHKDETEEDFDAGTFDNVEFLSGEDVALTESGEDFEEGELDGVVAGEDGLELEEEEDAFTKLSDPSSLPTGNGYGAAFSPDGTYLAVAHSTFPRITIYKRSGGTFTKLADPSTLPTSAGYGCAFDPTGTYLAVAHEGSPRITIYKRSGDTFTKLANPATLPTDAGRGCAFDPTGTYLAVAHLSSPYITIYKRSGDTFTKLANPATLPASAGLGCAFDPTGTYLAVAHEARPYITIYKRSGDTFTKLANPATLPPYTGRGCAFDPTGTYLAVAHSDSPYITIYKRNGDTFTKLANPSTLPTVHSEGCAFDPTGTYLAVAHWSSPYITIYKRSGDTFTKLSNPSTLPTGNGYGAAFSPDGTYLAVAHHNSPRITIYKHGFTESGSRISLPLDLSSVGTVKTSEISWQATFPASGEVGQPTFTRDSKAYLSDGTEVDAGAARFEQGKFDKALWVEEGTTNQIANPLTFSGWSTSETVMDNDGTFHPLNAKFIRVKNTAWGCQSNSIPASNGQTWSVSFIARKGTGDGEPKAAIMIMNPNDSHVSNILPSFSSKDIRNGWVRHEATFTINHADTGYIRLRFYVTATNGGYHDFALPQVEQKPYATSFTPGTRSPETLTIPTAGVLNPQEGAVALYLYVNPAHREPSRTRHFFRHFPGPGNANRISMQHNDTNFWLFTIGDANGNTHSLSIADNEVADGWRQFVMKWGAEEFAVYVDGIKKANLLNPTYLPSSVGDIITVSEYTNALLDDLAIFDYAPTDEEIQAWYEADAPISVLPGVTYKLGFDGNLKAGKNVTDIVIETALSLDGGETWGAWQQATNGGSIPGIVPDMDLSNAKLKTRVTLETEDISVTPILRSLSILLIAQKGLMLIFDPLGEQYAVSGTWTSPVIDLTALVAEANSLITWDDEVPEDTNLTIEAQVSVDGETWGEYQALTKNNPLPAWEGYIRYRITLTSNVTRSKTPVIKSVSMDFVSQCATEGVWIGPPMDLRGIIVGDTAATFSKDTPEGTGVVLYVGKGKSEEHVGEWEEIAQNGDPFDHDWFVRPKIVLTSDDGMVTPKVNSVTLNASQNGARGFWMTPVIDATAAIDKSSGRVHLESVSNAGAVTAWSRSSEDGESWSDWVAADADGKLNHSPDNYVQVAVEITADAELVRLTIYFDGTSSATIISDNYFPGGQFYFATLLDWLIIVNGIDPPRKYNGGLFQDNEVKAKLTTDLEGEKNDLVYTSKLHGALGNDITIEYHDPEEAEQELSIDITLYAIKINLATDENGAITTTAEDIKNAIEEHDDAKEIVEVNYAPGNDGSGVVTAMAATPLSGGITSAIVGGDPPYAHYVAAHKNRLWLASGSRLYFSEILNFEEWPALNFIDISPNDGDVITGLLTYGDYLIITKGHSLWMLTGDGFETFAVRRIHADRGAYAPRSLITVNDLVSFVSDDGIYFTDFTQAVLISERIKPFWQTLNARRFNQAASWFYDHKLYVAVPSGNSLKNDVVIVYDVLRQAFVGIYKGWNVSCWTSFREGGRIYSYYGHSDKTMVTQIATGYSDNDKPYVMMWRSKEFDFNTPEIYKRFNLMLFQVSPAVVEAEITVRFYVDGVYIGEIDVPIPQGIGNMIHNIRVLASKAGVVGGHRLALEVVQEVLNNPVGIQLISIEYVAHGIKPTIFR